MNNFRPYLHIEGLVTVWRLMGSGNVWHEIRLDRTPSWVNGIERWAGPHYATWTVWVGDAPLTTERLNATDCEGLQQQIEKAFQSGAVALRANRALIARGYEPIEHAERSDCNCMDCRECPRCGDRVGTPDHDFQVVMGHDALICTRSMVSA